MSSNIKELSVLINNILDDWHDGPSGPGKVGSVLIGTKAADTLYGTAGNDVINGRNGGDQIFGLGGNDNINGGKGNDYIDGGDGNDRIDGGQGDDVILGGAGNDRIDGGQGNDTLIGGAGNDIIDGGKGNDTITGGAGNDTINGGAGRDTAVFSGNYGDYTITFSNRHNRCDNDDDTVKIARKVSGSPDGTDTLKNIEVLKFDNGEYRDGHFYPSSSGNTAPTAPAQSAGATEGGASVTVNALGTAADANNDALTVVNVPTNLPAGVSFNAATHSFTFDPGNAVYNGLAAGATQTVVVSYGVYDGTATTPTSVSFIITGTNDAPALTGTQATLPGGTEDTAYTVSAANLGQGFSDVDGDTLLVSGLTSSNGSVHDNGNGTYTITSTANFNGAVTLDYSVIDGNGGSVAATQSYTLAAVNDAPVGSATATLAAGTEDTGYTVSAADLLAGFSDVDGDTLSVSGLATSNGAVVDHYDGTYTITPTANYNGAVTLDYSVIDGHGSSVAGTQSYTLAAVNDAPVAEADKQVVVPPGSATVGLNITAPTDVDGDALSITVSGVPSNGTINMAGGAAVVNGAHLSVSELSGLTFTPSGTGGSHSQFTYVVSDGLLTDTAAIDISLASAVPIKVAVVHSLDATGLDAATDAAAQLNDDTFFNFSASVVDLNAADSLTELSAYDVVVHAGSENNPMSAAYWSALRSYVETNDGGVVTTGFSYLPSLNPDADFVSPITPTYIAPLQHGQTFLVDSSHPITNGISSITVPDATFSFWEKGAALDSDAHSLASLPGDAAHPTIAYHDATASGRTVYLGGLYASADSPDGSYVTIPLRSGVYDQLFEQAVAWAGRGTSGVAAAGGDGNDILSGGPANDTLIGRGGNDLLTGGGGSDTFVYQALSDRGTTGDVVTDFTTGAGGDVLNLHDLLASVGAPHDSTAFSNNWLNFDTSSGVNTVVQVDSNGGGDSFVTLATLTNQLLTQSDIANYVL